MSTDHWIGADDDNQPTLVRPALRCVAFQRCRHRTPRGLSQCLPTSTALAGVGLAVAAVGKLVAAFETDGGRVAAAQPVCCGPSCMRRCPPRCSSRAVSHVRSSVSPLKVADCTYCAGPPGTGSTNPDVSITSSLSANPIRDSANEGALIRYRLWPATGNRPSEAHTYQELRPPESSFPGNPPRPKPNIL